MSEKLCLQWNDFKENVISAFGRLREDKEFTDVTLACEDGQQMEAHKVVLAASSPFFEQIFLGNKYPHPLIYFRGFKADDLATILDFLYFGEANVFQENLDSFLAIAEELKLKGLTGQTSGDILEEPTNPKPVNKTNEPILKSTTYRNDLSNFEVQNANGEENASRALAVPTQFMDNIQALDEKVKSLMERSQNMITYWILIQEMHSCVYNIVYMYTCIVYVYVSYM